MNSASTFDGKPSKCPRRDSRQKRRRMPSQTDANVKGTVPQERISQGDRPTKKHKQKGGPLNGMIVAVSTLDVKGQSHADSQSSYKAVAELCESLGATITGQLHRRVSCLVCNQTAVSNATQRVRKAVKKSVPLVDVAWVRQCREQQKRVDLERFRLDDVAGKVVESRVMKDSEITVTHAEADELTANGWSETASLGCCCVCHENGDDKCPWCTDCNAKR